MKIKLPKSTLSFLSLTLPLFLIVFSLTAFTKKGDWKKLFNGKNLKGWDIKISGQEMNDNYKNTFIVEDGILKVNYDEYEKFDGKFGHLYYKKPYSHYHLKIEYRIVGKSTPGSPSYAVANSGVMLHSQSAKDQQLNQNFPVSIEMQFLAAVDGEQRKLGNLASPGTHVEVDDKLYENHMLYASKDAPPIGEQWINIEAIVLGDSIVHHIVEGDTVLTYRHPQVGGWEKDNATGWVEDKTWVKKMAGTPLKNGYIALQAEGHPIHFRKVEIRDLSYLYKK